MNVLKSVKTNLALRKELRETRDALVNAKIEAGYWKNRAEAAEKRERALPVWEDLARRVGVPGPVLAEGWGVITKWLESQIR